MKKFFFTFGTNKQFPFQAGWIIMYANTRPEAEMRFRTLFPDRNKGCLNCSFVYNEARWAEMDPEHTWSGWQCHGVYGAIPPYVRPQLQKETLTDEVMDTALERCDLNSVSAESMRDACFEWMSHTAIFNDTLARVEKELTNDEGFHEAGLSPEEMVRVVAKEVQGIINDEEIISYRDKYVDPRMVKFTMESFGIKGKDPMLVANLIAAYAVIKDGIAETCRDELDAAQLTAHTVAMLVKDMLADDMLANRVTPMS